MSSVSGVQSVTLIERGTQIDIAAVRLSNRIETPATFVVHPSADSWYSLVVEDANQKIAYTNPVWVVVKKAPEQNVAADTRWFTGLATILSLFVVALAMRLRGPKRVTSLNPCP